MKIKPQTGTVTIPPVRISDGIVIRRMRDGSYIYAKRPERKYDNSECGQFYRDQMKYGAYLLTTAIPIEVESARNWQINSNDTWKDALMRAQFGTLFRIVLDDGTISYPAAHSCAVGLEPETLGMAWDALQDNPFVTGVGQTNIDFVVPSGYSEVMVLLRNVGGTNAVQNCLRASTDGGATFHATLGDYRLIASTGVESTATACTFNLASVTAQTSGAILIPNGPTPSPCRILQNITQAGTSCYFVANSLPFNAYRVTRPTGTMSGTTGSSWVKWFGRV